MNINILIDFIISIDSINIFNFDQYKIRGLNHQLTDLTKNIIL